MLTLVLQFLLRVLQSSREKSSKACARRIMHMMKNPGTVQNVNLYLSEAQLDKVSIDEIWILFKGRFLVLDRLVK